VWCEDPPGAPPRPLFTELDAKKLPYLAALSVPDYINASKNMNAIESLQFVISMTTSCSRCQRAPPK